VYVLLQVTKSLLHPPTTTTPRRKKWTSLSVSTVPTTSSGLYVSIKRQTHWNRHVSFNKCIWSVDTGVLSSPKARSHYSCGDLVFEWLKRLFFDSFYAPAIRRMVKNGGGALSVSPVRACVRPSVRPSVIKIWCPLNNFWKTASIQFKGMLIYYIKTQVEFDLGYNPLIFDRVMDLL